VNRRTVLMVLGGAAASWPLVARAQQTMPVIGFVRSTSLTDATHLIAAFRNGLREMGYVEGQNVVTEYRSAENDPSRLTTLLTDFVRRPVALIVGNVVSAIAAKTVTATVPIVFATGSDPVQDGLVSSTWRRLRRPSVSDSPFLRLALTERSSWALQRLAHSAPMR
jgi:putative tryptophan/tyrosine transport system substrate-binding protein